MDAKRARRPEVMCSTRPENVPRRTLVSRLNCTTNTFHAGSEGTSAPSGVVARRGSSAPFDFTGRTSPQSRTESWKNYVNFVEFSWKFTKDPSHGRDLLAAFGATLTGSA